MKLHSTNLTFTDIQRVPEYPHNPNPLNPGGISDLAYYRVMRGLHDDGWVRDFVPEMM